MAYPIT